MFRRVMEIVYLDNADGGSVAMRNWNDHKSITYDIDTYGTYLIGITGFISTPFFIPN